MAASAAVLPELMRAVSNQRVRSVARISAMRPSSCPRRRKGQPAKGGPALLLTRELQRLSEVGSAGISSATTSPVAGLWSAIGSPAPRTQCPARKLWSRGAPVGP